MSLLILLYLLIFGFPFWLRFIIIPIIAALVAMNFFLVRKNYKKLSKLTTGDEKE